MINSKGIHFFARYRLDINTQTKTAIQCIDIYYGGKIPSRFWLYGLGTVRTVYCTCSLIKYEEQEQLKEDYAIANVSDPLWFQC
jgi:hypothetical protein